MVLNNIDGHQFEDLVETLVMKMGFITKERKPSADGGIDLVLIDEKPIYRGKYIIQCKRQSQPISVSIIRDLFGVVMAERANKGILITNSTFTNASKEFAFDKPLELINGDGLLNLFDQYKIPVIKERMNNETLSMIDANVVDAEVYKQSYGFLIKFLSNIEKKRQKNKNGLNFLNKKEYPTLSKYGGFIFQSFNYAVDIINVVSRQISHLDDLCKIARKDLNYENINAVSSFSKEIGDNLIKLTKKEEQVISSFPLVSYLEVKKVLLDFYDHIFFELNNGFCAVPEDSTIDDNVKILIEGEKYRDKISEKLKSIRF